MSKGLVEKARFGDIDVKELFDDSLGYGVSFHYDGMIVEVVVEEIPKLRHGFRGVGTEPGEREGAIPGFIGRLDVVLGDLLQAIGGKVGYEEVNQVSNGVEDAHFVVDLRVGLPENNVGAAPKLRFGEVVVRKEVGGQPVINIVRVAGDLVCTVNDLRLDARRLAQFLHVELGQGAGVAMFDDPFANLP